MLFVHSPEEAQRAKRCDFLIHFILFLFIFSFCNFNNSSLGVLLYAECDKDCVVLIV